MNIIKSVKQNIGGFTLLELMLVILCASVITLAASGVLLFAMNSTNVSADQASQQNTARTVTMLLEGLAAKGDIAKVEEDFGAWTIYRKTEPAGEQEFEPILSYHPASGRIYDNTGTVFMDEVEASTLTLETKGESSAISGDGGLLTISITTAEGTYSTSVYSRRPIEGPQEETTEEVIEAAVDKSLSETDARMLFVKAALSAVKAYGKTLSSGDINAVVNASWPPDTPWCASFIAWLIAPGGCNVGKDIQGYTYGDKSNPLNTGYVQGYFNSDYFEKITWLDAVSSKGTVLHPGDLIFFDWNLDGNLDHIGVVAYTNGKMVYTVEGNTGDTIAMRQYRIVDPVIAGYRVIPWVTSEVTPAP